MTSNIADNFKPMLAKDGDLDKIKWPQVGQIKLDGIRASVVNGRLVSRTLKLIPNQEIQAALGCPEFEGLDGELIVGDPAAEDCYRRTTSFVMSESKTGEPWTYRVFDLWDSPDEFTRRYAALEDAVEGWMSSNTSGRIKLVPSVVLPNVAALEAFEAEALAAGHEGVILRDPNARYKFGRSGKTGPLLKVKRFIDFEAEVIGVYEEMHNANEAKTNALGRTERSSHAAGKVGKGTLGGLVLRAINGPSEGIEFRCGTGFDAAQRLALWSEAFGVDTSLAGFPATGMIGLNGRIAKIKSFPIGVKDKPRHPVFLGWRDMEVDG